MILSRLLFVIFFISTGTISQDHHEDEDAFTHLTEVTGSSSEEFLDSNALTKLLDTLKRRTDCTGQCAQCLSVERINELTNRTDTNTGFSEESFHEAAWIIINALVRGNCTEIGNSSQKICRKTVDDIIREIEKKYDEESNSAQCFNQHTLLEEACTNHTEDVMYGLLTNLFEGKCILPSSQSITDELFEHLHVDGDVVNDEAYTDLLNELGIGTITSPSTGSETDEDSHDHKRKKRDTHEEEDHEHHARCYSSEQLKSIFGYGANLTRDQLLEMCPVFMQQLVEKSCVLAATTETPTNRPPTYTTAMKYGYGTAAVAVISLLAFVGLVFFPVLGSVKFRLTMQFFIALGVGTMSGDAIFHIIPEVAGLHNHDASEPHDEAAHGNEVFEYIWKLVVVVAGIWALFVFENGLKVFSKKPMAHSHNHVHGHEYRQQQVATPERRHVTRFTKITEEEIAAREGKYSGLVDPGPMNGSGTLEQGVSANDKEGHSSQPAKEDERKTYFWGITIVGIMVFLGDALHNFGDGIAIGAAFSISWVQGVGTSLAIIFHELPHEFGDFAIYMNNGLTKWRALILNFVAACCCFIGLYVGIAVSENAEVRLWLLAFVAGMFLYISLVNVLHEMVEDVSTHPKLQFLLQNVGLLLGWAILLVIAIYEEPLIDSISS